MSSGSTKCSCCACHQKQPEPTGDQVRGGSHQRVRVLHLPRKTTQKSRAKSTKVMRLRKSSAKSAAPGWAPTASKRPPALPGVARATQKQPQRQQSDSKSTKCCACHAKAAGPHHRPSARRHFSAESQSAVPGTPKQLQSQQSGAPATQSSRARAASKPAGISQRVNVV